MKVSFAGLAFLAAFAGTACAQDKVTNKSMTRVLSCKGPDASMEVYLPSNLVSGRGVSNVRLSGSVTGQYVLDLSEAGKTLLTRLRR